MDAKYTKKMQIMLNRLCFFVYLTFVVVGVSLMREQSVYAS